MAEQDLLRAYILEGDTAVRVPFLTWLRWYAHLEHRRVAQTQVAAGCEVSTIFEGLDYGGTAPGPPLLYETQVFWAGHALHHAVEQYATWEDAEHGHARMVARVREAGATSD